MARPELHIDFETRSTVDLKAVGLPNYSVHPDTDLWCACWTFSGDGFSLKGEWRQGWATGEIAYAMGQKPALFAHNAGFEHGLWIGTWGPKWGVPVPDDFDRWTCTAAMAAAMALPRDLARASRVMGLDVEKDDAGRRLMLQMCKPRSKAGVTPVVWWDEPEKIDRLVAYCHTDVAVEKGLAKSLRPLSEAERAVWLLDHRINERGVQVDLEAVRAARRIATQEQERLRVEMELATDHKVRTVTHPASITNYLRAQGFNVERLDKTSIKDLLADPELPAPVKKVVRIRDEARRSSLAKLDAFLLRTSADGRLRKNLMYHGASTGRWTGEGVQLQNLMRPWMKHGDIEAAIAAFEAEDPDLLRLIFSKPDAEGRWAPTALDVIANAMKSMIVAAPGHELVMADFSNIEGRVLAWLAGELWKLQAFRDFDAGTGPDLYVAAVAKVMGMTYAQVDDFFRQIGKVVELSLGFGGGHGAFLNMAGNYGVTPSMIAGPIKQATDPWVWELAAEAYDPRNRHELAELEWVALRVTIDGWRDAHPELCRKKDEAIGEPGGYWAQLETAAFNAVAQPGRAFKVGTCAFVSTRSVLWLKLPSNRVLAYANPQIRDVETPWGDYRPAVTFMGVHQKTKQWVRHSAYGGLWSQQVTQATARDLMAAAMVRLEGASWPVVLTVHDEIVCEVRTGTVSGQTFGEVMRELPEWASGLPVAAKGLTSPRYRK